MLRTRLLTATAAIALFGASAAFAQDAQPTPPADAMAPAQSTTQTTPTPPAPTPAPAQAPAATTPVQTPGASAAAGVQATTPATTNTVVDVLKANGQFTTLLAALDAAQLTDTLKTQPAISIFAPTDAAFAALSEEERTRLLDPANVNELRQLLLYHVIVADVNSSQIEGTKGGVETAARTQVELDGTGSAIKVDGATVTQADLDASNGAVFVIDRVLSPGDSQVASGDADEADAATAPADETTDAATPPTDDSEAATPPTDETMQGDDGDNDSATTDGEVAPPPAETTTAPAGSTSATRSTTSVNAPNGQPAATTTTTASPPVNNPTDGQRDGTTRPN